MLSLMNEFTDDPDWVQSIQEDGFVGQWKHRSLSKNTRITQQMVDWCVQEVQDRARPFYETQLIPALDHGVYKSDTIVGSALNRALRNSLGRLERVNGHRKVHGQQNFVVDPYLYPFRFGVTKYRSSEMSTFEDCIRISGKGISRSLLSSNVDGRLDETQSYKIDNAWSLNFQWLPCNISFEEVTGKARITSYINNVHPVLDREVYTVANELLSAFIPMLNSTLMAVKTSQLFYPRIDLEERTSREDFPDPDPGPYRSCKSRLRTGKLAKDGNLPTSVRIDLQKEFWDIGIQAVIQVSSINLDQENPTFPGEDWHVQGQLNERICATVIYCYSSSNISEASISFRHRCDSEDLMSLNALTRTTKETEDVYGVKDLEPAVQEQGSVVINEGRVISFPNVFQTKINPIKLNPSAKTGHLKMFVMHLIDPNRRIMSTSMVPCQRRDWWARETVQKVPVLRRLPVEIFRTIIEVSHMSAIG
ncbi:MAG: hypothetical protein Q9226_001111 [Calogaya cf. arnoldii]